MKGLKNWPAKQSIRLTRDTSWVWIDLWSLIIGARPLSPCICRPAYSWRFQVIWKPTPQSPQRLLFWFAEWCTNLKCVNVCVFLVGIACERSVWKQNCKFKKTMVQCSNNSCQNKLFKVKSIAIVPLTIVPLLRCLNGLMETVLLVLPRLGQGR